MSVIDESLYGYLVTYAGLVSLVSTRVYSFRMPDAPTLPCVTFQRVSTPREHAHDTTGIGTDLAHARFQFDSWAETYASAKAITDQIRAALNGKTGLIGAQVETATVLGTVTSSGTVSVVVTATGLAGSPITLTPSVVATDTATIVAGKIRTALLANAVIAAFFTVGGTGATITLTRANSASISNLNISTANGSCAGLTSAPTSTDTSYSTTTLLAGLADDERAFYEPDTRLFHSSTDFTLWYVD